MRYLAIAWICQLGVAVRIAYKTKSHTRPTQYFPLGYQCNALGFISGGGSLHF